jgi:hypothetical protein
MSEKQRVELRVTAYNFPNHPCVRQPGMTVGNAEFGTIGKPTELRPAGRDRCLKIIVQQPLLREVTQN